MRWLVALALCLVVSSAAAQADTVADLDRPSSTSAGCLNTWNPTDPTDGASTCEGRAALQSWQERATAIITTRNIVIDASRDPDRADKETVLSALNTLAASADAITSSFHPQPPARNPFVTTLSWMRQQFEMFHLPLPASLGDGFRTMGRMLDDPRILIAACLSLGFGIAFWRCWDVLQFRLLERKQSRPKSGTRLLGTRKHRVS